ncbi:Tat pathway signal protein [Moraxella caviae]|uniref:Predicted phosphatase n=1 Tax=Moraxella caviae TaxID=34060 RepID=A0A1S9ZWS1_9GAMM|nr:PhoX family phosphatase [Moraxella caviae]OOR87391.1 Tat pathway signal protein [Moraxella caviae]STZ10383.1 Predicted phosphatase [Moraxella caviae]VEW10539.1 Predicted phosphatase [Moraxella caviae]
MGKPLARLHAEHDITNQSDNYAFSQIAERLLSRRRVLQGMGLSAAAAALPTLASANANIKATGVRAKTLGFKSVPFSTEDAVIVPEGYTARAFYKWGDAVGIAGNMPAFKTDASNSSDEQAVQAGMHHDGMAFFSLPFGSQKSNRGLLAMNHEYVDNGLLFTDGTANWSADKVRKSQNAMGISVIEVRKHNGEWQVVRPSQFARRITPHTLMALTGPAAGHTQMQTADDPRGLYVRGTMQNCANGKTPWGTYLTCEENWSDIFVRPSGNMTDNEKRYGIGKSEDGYLWSQFDTRFNTDNTPNEPNRFGWVVEIDPFDPESIPKKHTSLGRFKHEGAEMIITPSNQVAVYMGDDQRFEYIYKFVSKDKYKPNDRAHNMKLLSEGTLYVARFNDDGTGEWLPLVHGQNGLTAENGFADQGEVLIKTRQAADVLGATKMDRPEWISADPFVKGSLYCTLTNNNQRGAEGKPDVDAANPRKDNRFGHIIRWLEQDGDGAKTRFSWDILVLAGNKMSTKKNHQGNIKGDDFGSPDGLAFDYRGVLWVQTDVSASTINIKDYAGMGNNQMLATIPETGEFRRFLTAPNGAEVTGIAFTPDNKTLFINIQHPGEPATGDSDPANPLAVSMWPDGPNGGRPRAATVVITKDDGGVIGS